GVVSEGEDGLLVAPGDVDDLVEKLEIMLTDRERARQMGRSGRAKVEVKYAWPQIGAKLADVYAQVIGERRGE
ncbi:MAG: glycosyltransferase, partial [Chloroflexi bacterium]|nr:glycosyltransferase [Chloroflexota bacterium]